MGKRTKKIAPLLFVLILAFVPRGSTSADAASPGLPARCTIALIRDRGLSEDMVGEKILATFRVEIVTGNAGMEKGLAGRESMPPEEGMLFVLNPEEARVFWMKGMRFPLDIIFLDEGKKILEIFETLQPCEQCSVFTTKEPAAYTLEINAGLSRRYGLKKGDTLVFESRE